MAAHTRSRLPLLATLLIAGACDQQFVDAVGASNDVQAGQGGFAGKGVEAGRGGSGGPAGTSGQAGTGGTFGTGATGAAGFAGTAGTTGATGGTESEAGSEGMGEAGRPTAGSGGTDCTGPCCGVGGEDRDGDGTRNCEDGCPDQPDKIEPGVCGCDIPEEDRPDVAGCLGLVAALIHRYPFEGTGDVARDTAWLAHGAAAEAYPAADGALINTLLSGFGRVNLAGGPDGDPDQGDDQYVALPSDLVSNLQSVTVEAWLIWYGGDVWQRIFDFGNNDSDVPGQQGGTGTSYLFLTPAAGISEQPVRVAYKRADFANEVLVNSTRPFPRGVDTHVAVTFDGPTQTLALYLDGALEDSLEDADAVTGIPVRLDLIDDTYDWIGRSQFRVDAEIHASFAEFRIYAAALTADQIRTSAAAGPDPVFFPNQ